jgi:DNA-binding protein YbaB
MGVLDMAKAMQKAQATKSKMSKLQAAGTSNMVSILLNGLSELVEVEIDTAKLKTNPSIASSGLSDRQISDICDLLANDLKKAYIDAKKEVERLIMSTTSIDDLKDMLN